MYLKVAIVQYHRMHVPRLTEGRARRKADRRGDDAALVMALLLPGGIDQGVGGGLRRGQRVVSDA